LAQIENSGDTSIPLCYAEIALTLSQNGFLARGGFHPGVDDGVSGATVILVGNAGPEMWREYHKTRQTAGALTLDGWTRRILDSLSCDLGARVIYPFDGPPHAPFQRWAAMAEPVFSSPIGMTIHTQYGLWHAYRGAFLFENKVALPQRNDPVQPCLSCADQPCLSACPVHAFSKDRYDVDACADQLRRAEGFDCKSLGCRARRSCPVGVKYQYQPAQAAFHMAAFLKAR